MMKTPKGLRTWVEVDKKAIQKNFKEFSKILKKSASEKTKNQSAQKTARFMAVVKSNAYGHNLVPFAKEMQKLGVDYFGVDSVVEALRLREEKIKKPILVLGYTLSENVSQAVKENIEITLSSEDQLKKLLALKCSRPVRVHVKIDTGMHRQGFYPEEGEKIARRLAKEKKIKVVGIYTHFANGKNPSFPKDSREQMRRFQIVLDAFEKHGFTQVIRHASATSGALLYPEYHFDMVRIGIGMYGLWPSIETQRVCEETITLTPALTWKTVIGEVKQASKGEAVGYDFTETFETDKKLAVLPVGYWHGYSRVLSSVGHVLVKGQRARVLGRISMDMMVVDVTHIPRVSSRDTVTLLGEGKFGNVSAVELGMYAGTSSYEIVTRINPKIQRLYS